MNNTRPKWSEVIGGLWAQVFQNINLPSNGVVVEVAPGEEPKIGIGLAKVGFTGTIYLVEPNEQACKAISEKYSSMLNAEVKVIQGTLAEAMPQLPSNIDGLIANHPLDDMILGSALDKHSRDEIFTNHYSAPIEKTRMQWDFLTAKPNQLEQCIASAVNDWSRVVKQTQPKNVIISQYRSYFFSSNNFTTADDAAIEALAELEARYRTFSRKDLLPSGISDSSLWLILQSNQRTLQ